MKNLGVFGLKFFFIIGALLKEARKSIYSSIILILRIIYLKIISEKLFDPLDLSKAEILCIFINYLKLL